MFRSWEVCQESIEADADVMLDNSQVFYEIRPGPQHCMCPLVGICPFFHQMAILKDSIRALVQM